MKRKEGKASRVVGTADSSSGARAKRPKVVTSSNVAAAGAPSPPIPHGKDAVLALLAAAAPATAIAIAQFPQPKGKGKEKQVTEVEGKKAVFRPVLSSPYHVAWPQLAPVHATPILHTLLALLASDELKGSMQRSSSSTELRMESEPVSESVARRQRRRKTKERLAAKKSSVGKAATSKTPFNQVSSRDHLLIIGINSITRHLEGLIRSSLLHRYGDASGGVSAPRESSGQLLLFICKEDLDPASLAAHIPLLVCAYNAACSASATAAFSGAMILVGLPVNSELAISTALGVRRCSSFLLDTSSLTLNKNVHALALQARLDEASLVPLRAPWLEAASAVALSNAAPWAYTQPRPPPTAARITHLRTNTPSDKLSAKGIKKTLRGQRTNVRKDARAEKQREVGRAKKMELSQRRRQRAEKGKERSKLDREKAKKAKEAASSKSDCVLKT